MGMGFDFLLVILLFLGGGVNTGKDLLGMMPTDAYWQFKHVTVTAAQLETDAGPTPVPDHVEVLIHDLESPDFKQRKAAQRKIYAMGTAALPSLKRVMDSKDPEVKTAATELVTRLESHQREREVRRLMAIRTLGERNEQGAMELLKGLESSKELFVGDYAARAVARLQGKKFLVPDRQSAVAEDLKLLPGDASIIAQIVGFPFVRDVMTAEGYADATLDSVKMLPPGLMPPDKIPSKEVVLHRIMARLLQVADRVGDVRVDGVTVEVSNDLGPAKGSAVLIIRGEYDRDALIESLQMLPDNEGMKVTADGQVQELQERDGSPLVLFPSNEQAIFILGDKPAVIAAEKATMLAALKTGRGTLSQNESMSSLLKTVDTHSPLWVVARLNEEMRKEKLFEGFGTITLVTKAEKEGMSFLAAGEGKDADLVKGSVEELKSDIVSAIASLQPMAAKEKQVQAVVDFLQKLNVTEEGAHAKLSGTFSAAMVRTIAESSAPGILMDTSMDDAAEGAPVDAP